MTALRSERVKFHATGHGHHLPFFADFLVPSLRLAIFIDGCYWHACPRHYPSDPAAKRRSRPSRIADRERSREVRLADWTPMRVWECQAIEDMIVRALSQARKRSRSFVAGKYTRE